MTVSGMQKLYDRYFASHDYKRRYPAPNPATLQFLLQQGQAITATSILDVGCGDGRYAIALLDATQATMTGCDISGAALAEFSEHLKTRPDAERVRHWVESNPLMSRKGGSPVAAHIPEQRIVAN